MTTTDRKILERFKELLRKELPDFSLILFGSRARGDEDAYSDMDVLVLVGGKCDDKTRDYVSNCAWEAGYEQGIVIVPVVFTRNEWETGPERYSLLVQAVKREGLFV